MSKHTLHSRGYFVHDKDEEEWGVPVVAPTALEAKKLAFASSELSGYWWIDLRCRWQRDANVDGLPIGVVHGCMDALRRNIYHWLDGATCDICDKEDTYVESLDGMAVCLYCVKRVYYEWDHPSKMAGGV